MKVISLRVDDRLRDEMKRLKWVNWSEVLRESEKED